MILTPVSGIGSTQNSAEKTTQTMGKEDFLKLLVTQLRNQDPLQPMESTEFAAQLAQFSSVEQLTNVNSKLETMLKYEESLNNAQAIGLIGKTVRASGNTVTLQEGSGTELHYTLSKDASDVTINIYDKEGKLVKSQNVGGQQAGNQSYIWDGADAAGNPSPPGNYRFEVKAKDAKGNDVAATTLMEGMVTGITFKGGVAYLTINGALIPAGDVTMVVTDSRPVADSKPKS